MALNKERIFYQYIDEINIEQARRLVGTKQIDLRANYLWEEALKSVDADEKKQLIDAYKYAKTINYIHPGLSSDIYFAHPLRVASLAILFSNEHPLEAGIIGLLHNVFEVSATSQEDINNRFGNEILFMINTLTVDRKLQWDLPYKKKYYSGIYALSENARKVKVIDKFDNLFTLGLNPDTEVRSKYLDEIKMHIVPLVNQDLAYMSDYFSRLIINCEKTGKL